MKTIRIILFILFKYIFYSTRMCRKQIRSWKEILKNLYFSENCCTSRGGVESRQQAVKSVPSPYYIHNRYSISLGFLYTYVWKIDIEFSSMRHPNPRPYARPARTIQEGPRTVSTVSHCLLSSTVFLQTKCPPLRLPRRSRRSASSSGWVSVSPVPPTPFLIPKTNNCFFQSLKIMARSHLDWLSRCSRRAGSHSPSWWRTWEAIRWSMARSKGSAKRSPTSSSRDFCPGKTATSSSFWKNA